MQFKDFFQCLSERPRTVRVEVETLRELVNNHHQGVGVVTFKYFKDFAGAQYGMFIWLEEDQTSAYEEPFKDAVVFVNDRFEDDRAMRRVVGAKELMHVFDVEGQRTNDPDKYRRLLREIESTPVAEDMSDQYSADRAALWKSILCLVPPWVRSEFKAQWDGGSVKAHEIATRLWLPEATVSAALGEYYDRAMKRFLPDWK